MKLKWNEMKTNGIEWNGIKWNGMELNEMKWNWMGWNQMKSNKMIYTLVSMNSERSQCRSSRLLYVNWVYLVYCSLTCMMFFSTSCLCLIHCKIICKAKNALLAIEEPHHGDCVKLSLHCLSLCQNSLFIYLFALKEKKEN